MLCKRATTGRGDPRVHTPPSLAKSALLSKQNSYVLSYKILIPRGKGLEVVHEFGGILYAGKSNLTRLRYLSFKIFLLSIPQTPLEELGPMAKIESALM